MSPATVLAGSEVAGSLYPLRCRSSSPSRCALSPRSPRLPLSTCWRPLTEALQKGMRRRTLCTSATSPSCPHSRAAQRSVTERGHSQIAAVGGAGWAAEAGGHHPHRTQRRRRSPEGMGRHRRLRLRRLRLRLRRQTTEPLLPSRRSRKVGWGVAAGWVAVEGWEGAGGREAGAPVPSLPPAVAPAPPLTFPSSRPPGKSLPADGSAASAADHIHPTAPAEHFVRAYDPAHKQRVRPYEPLLTVT